jgi:hypothetical protein
MAALEADDGRGSGRGIGRGIITGDGRGRDHGNGRGRWCYVSLRYSKEVNTCLMPTQEEHSD